MGVCGEGVCRCCLGVCLESSRARICARAVATLIKRRAAGREVHASAERSKMKNMVEIHDVE